MLELYESHVTSLAWCPRLAATPSAQRRALSHTGKRSPAALSGTAREYGRQRCYPRESAARTGRMSSVTAIPGLSLSSLLTVSLSSLEYFPTTSNAGSIVV